MADKTLIQDLILAPLDVLSREVLPLIEKDYARLAATEGLDRIKQTVSALLDEDPNNKDQVNLIWGTVTSDPQIVEAVRGALLDAISNIKDPILQKGLSLLVAPIIQTLSAVTDTVKPDGDQLKTIWVDFLKSPEFSAFVLANLDLLLKLIIKNPNLEKIILGILKVFIH